MSLIFFDGFDQYSAGADLLNYGGWTSLSNIVPVATVRIGTGKAVSIGTHGGYGGVNLTYKSQTNYYNVTVYFGFALMVDSSTAGSFTIVDSANTEQVSLRVTFITATTYRLDLYRGATLLAAGRQILTINTWRYIELKVKINDTTGIFECRIDSTVDNTFTGNTKNSANSEMYGIYMTGGGDWSNAAVYIDDFYYLNSNGATNNTYLGEQLALFKTPISDNSITWSRNNGTSNFGQIHEAVGAQDGDTTYLYSNTPGQKDMYNLSSLAGVQLVSGVKVITRAEKDNVNALSLKTGIKIGAIDQQVTHGLGIGYANFQDIFETRDGAGTPISSADLDATLLTIQLP